MKSIATRGKTVEIPTHVSELTPKQYRYFCFLAMALNDVLDMEYFRIRWMSFLIGMGETDYTILKPQYVEELKAQESAIDGFFTEMNGAVMPDFSTPVNLLPEYEGFKGPGDWLDGVTFGEFTECMTIMESVAAVDHEDPGEAYAQIARRLYRIPEGEKVPMLLTFHAPMLLTSVWRAISTEPVEINGRKLDLRIIFKGSGSSKPDDNTGWTGITFEVATAGLFGSVAEVEKTDLWSVLIYLYKCKFEYLNEKRNEQK